MADCTELALLGPIINWTSGSRTATDTPASIELHQASLDPARAEQLKTSARRPYREFMHSRYRQSLGSAVTPCRSALRLSGSRSRSARLARALRAGINAGSTAPVMTYCGLRPRRTPPPQDILNEQDRSIAFHEERRRRLLIQIDALGTRDHIDILPVRLIEGMPKGSA